MYNAVKLMVLKPIALASLFCLSQENLKYSRSLHGDMEKRGIMLIVILFLMVLLFSIHAITDDDLFSSDNSTMADNLSQGEPPPNEVLIPEEPPSENIPTPAPALNPTPSQTPLPEEIPDLSAVDIEKEAGITPDNPFWGFDVTFDRMVMSLLINPSRLEFRHEERVAKGLKIAEERLWEMQLMAEQNDVSSLAKASHEYQIIIGKIQKDINALDEEEQEKSAVAILRLNSAVKVHEQLLKQTQETINSNIKGGFTEKEQALFGSVIAGMQSSGQGFQSTFQQKKDSLVIVVEESPMVDDVQAYVPEVPLQPATNQGTDANQAKVKLAEAYSQRDLVFQKAQDAGFAIPVETQQKIDFLLQEAKNAYAAQQYGDVRELVEKATVLLETLDGDISSGLQ